MSQAGVDKYELFRPDLRLCLTRLKKWKSLEDLKRPGGVVCSLVSWTGGGGHPRLVVLYSMRRACIGSMLAARRAGMNPARAAKAESTSTATDNVSGSYR